jgi:hypothetical protein
MDDRHELLKGPLIDKIDNLDGLNYMTNLGGT